MKCAVAHDGSTAGGRPAPVDPLRHLGRGSRVVEEDGHRITFPTPYGRHDVEAAPPELGSQEFEKACQALVEIAQQNPELEEALLISVSVASTFFDASGEDAWSLSTEAGVTDAICSVAPFVLRLTGTAMVEH